MALGEKTSFDSWNEPPSSGMRRGACPTLMAPMQTGDGLLARLRPDGGILSAKQFIQLTDAAQRHGNGIVEVTSRGSLQIRGLRTETFQGLAADLTAAGISVPPGPAIELSPLHGLCANEIGDPAEVEALLRANFAAELLSPNLAPKLSILIDGGGICGIDEVSGDIRVTAIDRGVWQVAINGNRQSAQTLATGCATVAVAAVGRLLHLLLSLGRHTRCRAIEQESLLSAFPLMDMVKKTKASGDRDPPVGTLALKNGSVALCLRLRFGQIRAKELVPFLRFANDLGATEVRPGPGRAFFLVGLTPQSALALSKIAPEYGLSADQDDPSMHIAACAGAGACASAHYHTKTRAERTVETAPELLEGSMVVHFSGCAKGCAHPHRGLSIVGALDGYQLILDGQARDIPDAQIAGGDIDSAIERLARLVKNERQAGESAAASLRRVGKADIIKALRQG